MQIEFDRGEAEACAMLLEFYAIRTKDAAEEWSAKVLAEKIRKQLDAASPLKRIWKGGRVCKSK